MERQQELKWLPRGCDLYGKKEGEILALSVKLISQEQKGHYILAVSCCLHISAIYCIIFVSDNNLQSTNWR